MKQYVQDLVMKESKMVYNHLYEQDGMVYVCGKVAMAEAVNNAIVEAIDKHMTDCDKEFMPAVDFVNSLKDEGRYNQDIFGQ